MYNVNTDSTGAYWLWNRRYSIRGCEIKSDASTKNVVCIMSTVDL